MSKFTRQSKNQKIGFQVEFSYPSGMISDMSRAVLDFKSSDAVTALFQIRRAASAAIGTFSLGDSSTGSLVMVYDLASQDGGSPS